MVFGRINVKSAAYNLSIFHKTNQKSQ